MKSRAFVIVALIASLLGPIVGIGASSAATIPFAGLRPFTLVVPLTYDSAIPAPLIIALSGYNQTGADMEKYLHLTSLAAANGILYVYPDGTKDSRGVRFWNGTTECCDFQSPKVDDDSYLMSMIDQISAHYSVDPNRIYIIGHSNGGFLANALGCRHADRIAAVVSIAGASYTKIPACKPSAPISVLEIWGTKDVTFVGNHIRGSPIPGAVTTFKNWGVIDGCTTTPVILPDKLDLDTKVPGAETTVTEFQGCPAQTIISYWQMAGSGHSPQLSQIFNQKLLDFLLAHPKTATN